MLPVDRYRCIGGPLNTPGAGSLSSSAMSVVFCSQCSLGFANIFALADHMHHSHGYNNYRQTAASTASSTTAAGDALVQGGQDHHLGAGDQLKTSPPPPSLHHPQTTSTPVIGSKRPPSHASTSPPSRSKSSRPSADPDSVTRATTRVRGDSAEKVTRCPVTIVF